MTLKTDRDLADDPELVTSREVITRYTRVKYESLNSY